jgi:hypothetical protein
MADVLRQEAISVKRDLRYRQQIPMQNQKRPGTKEAISVKRDLRCRQKRPIDNQKRPTAQAYRAISSGVKGHEPDKHSPWEHT